MGELIKVRPEHVNVSWTYMDKLIQKALDTSLGEYNLADIKKYLSSGSMDVWLWMGKEGTLVAVVTQITHYPRLSVMEVLLVGAKEHTFTEWFDKGWDTLEEYAREKGVQPINKGYQ